MVADLLLGVGGGAGIAVVITAVGLALTRRARSQQTSETAHLTELRSYLDAQSLRLSAAEARQDASDARAREANERAYRAEVSAAEAVRAAREAQAEAGRVGGLLQVAITHIKAMWEWLSAGEQMWEWVRSGQSPPPPQIPPALRPHLEYLPDFDIRESD